VLGIEGMHRNEGMELIKYLYNHVVTLSSAYGQQWNVGDLLVWDNPSTMHAPVPARVPDTPRTLQRKKVSKHDYSAHWTNR
jgi:alpha-ketoglutarate-dependent taurine dioxygenase